MTENKRIPLPSHLATRDSTLGKDGILKNFYEESTPLGEMIVKRPGQANSIALGPCVAQGSTFFNGNDYFICSNVVYVNPPGSSSPPVCPVPGSTSNFGNANTNTFATIDPVTGLIWASESPNIHKVAVYNPTTGALVTEISIPSTSGDTQKIFYVTASRKMVMPSTGTSGVVNFFVINPDSYVVEKSLVTGTGAGWQGATAALDNATTKIVVYNSSAIGGGGNLDVDYITYAVSGANPYPILGNPVSDSVHSPDLPIFALLGVGYIYFISDIGGSITSTQYTFTASSFKANAPTCYDIKRKYFWIVEPDTHNLYFIPVSGGTPGTKTLVSTLPAQTNQICYDPGRDVLWATFGDGMLRKISPADGSILFTTSGANTSFFPGLVGTKLLLLNECTLIQNSGQSGNSFTKIGIQ